MAPNRFTSSIDWTKTQLAVLFVMMMLAVDTINPVKVVLHVFPFIMPWHVFTVCLIFATYVFIKDMKDLLYFSVKVFFHSILSIFFRDVEIVGIQNVPTFGPCIFSINHANQFVDSVMLVCTCQRPVSYLMAEVSYRRRVVGDIAWAMGVVPVKRAQDDAVKGIGKITIAKGQEQEQEQLDDNGNDDKDGDAPPATGEGEKSNKVENASYLVTGQDTTFTTQLKVGDKIRPPGTPAALKIKEIQNDTTLLLDGAGVSDSFETFDEPRSFDVLKRIDQKDVYEKVLDRIASGGAIGIFPEGGSHDRTDLLPLKVGVALIAYSALEKDGINVPIVPVGLNYFKAHRWRGRAVVEFGRPIRINPSTLKSYREGGQERRKVCNELLARVQDSMKSVIVSAPDYETLQVIHTARRLYQRKGQMETKEKQDLNRRFAEGYKRLLLMTDGKPPKEWLDLQDRLLAYHRELTHLGVRDYQVPTLKHGNTNGEFDGDTVLGYLDAFYQILHLLFLLLLAAVPTLLINLPIGVMAGMYSESRRKVLLARSKVKVRAYDVVLTEKVLFCIVMIPCLWFLYGIILYQTNMDGPALALSLGSMPLFAYMGIIFSEAGMVDAKDLRPWIMKLFPSSRKRLAALPDTRRELQRDLRSFIKKLGPVLGEIYYKKDLDWEAIQEKTRLASAKPPVPSPEPQHRRELSDTLEIPESEIKASEVPVSTVPPTIEDLSRSFHEQQMASETVSLVEETEEMTDKKED